VAIAAALQESGLVNLDHGDQDSLGLFQERPSQAGAPQRRSEPRLLRHPVLPTSARCPRLAADERQRRRASRGTLRVSDAYAQHEKAAREIVAAVAGAACTDASAGTGDCARTQAPNAAALAAINYACRRQGLPYVWAATATRASTARASHRPPTTPLASPSREPPKPNTTQVPMFAQANYCCLAIWSSTAPHPTSTHVGIYIGGGLMIDAPRLRQRVKSEPYAEADFLGATRPAK